MPGHRRLLGAAVAVVPDATGNGYWVVTNIGAVYPFGDAVNYGQPGRRAADHLGRGHAERRGYWILDGGGQVFPFGNAARWAACRPARPGASTRPRPSSTPPTAGGTGS